MTRLTLVASVGAVTVAVLYRFGLEISRALHLPVQAVLMDAFYLPAAVFANTVWRGSTQAMYLSAALFWPSVALVVAIVRRGLRPSVRWGAAAQWCIAITVLVAVAGIVAGAGYALFVGGWWLAWMVAILAVTFAFRRRLQGSAR